MVLKNFQVSHFIRSIYVGSVLLSKKELFSFCQWNIKSTFCPKKWFSSSGLAFQICDINSYFLIGYSDQIFKAHESRFYFDLQR